jgi:hypothetical protein
MAAEVKLEDASRFFGELGERMLAAARIGLVKAGERGLQKLVAEIIPSRSPQPVDRGTYRAGWKTERVSRDVVAIFNPEPHAPFIEGGVRAENVKIGAAMIRALAEWALRKGIADDEQSAIGVAWAIAKTMQKDGIFNPMGRKGLGILRELNENFIDDILREEVSREMQQAARQAR